TRIECVLAQLEGTLLHADDLERAPIRALAAPGADVPRALLVHELRRLHGAPRRALAGVAVAKRERPSLHDGAPYQIERAPVRGWRAPEREIDVEPVGALAAKEARHALGQPLVVRCAGLAQRREPGEDLGLVG